MVCKSVCRSVTIVSPAKTTELVEMSFGMLSWVDPRKDVIKQVQIPLCEGAVLSGKVVAIAHCKV